MENLKDKPEILRAFEGVVGRSAFKEPASRRPREVALQPREYGPRTHRF